MIKIVFFVLVIFLICFLSILFVKIFENKREQNYEKPDLKEYFREAEEQKKNNTTYPPSPPGGVL